MRWKYLFWDLDGTLTDPMQGITRSVQYALRSFGIEVSDLETLCPFIGPPLRDSFIERYAMSEADAERAVSKYREYYTPTGIFENALYTGIPELLAEFQHRGAIHVMATSKPTIFAERIAEHFDLTRYFTLISGSTLDNSRTSKAEVIGYALSELGIDPSQAVMIGDRRYDIEGAAQRSLHAIGVTWGYGSREELEEAAAPAIASNPEELARLLG